MPKIVLIIGPSGVGKDTLINGCKNKINANFVKRHITRRPDNNEQNFYLSDEDFDKLENDGFFVSSWCAHSNRYGIAKNQITSGLNIISISRSTIKDFEELYDDVTTVEITLPLEEIYKRLKARGRENKEDIQKRVARSYDKISAKRLIQFDNSKPIEESIQNFINLL